MFPESTRILIVDDMPKMRQIVTNQVESLGYKNIFVAANGQEALTILYEHRATLYPVGVVLSDWNMPVMHGIDLLIAVRKSPDFKHLPFIMVTAEGQRDQVMQAIKEGVSNYIVKPFPPLQLELKLKAVWDRLSARKLHPEHGPEGSGSISEVA